MMLLGMLVKVQMLGMLWWLMNQVKPGDGEITSMVNLIKVTSRTEELQLPYLELVQERM